MKKHILYMSLLTDKMAEVFTSANPKSECHFRSFPQVVLVVGKPTSHEVSSMRLAGEFFLYEQDGWSDTAEEVPLLWYTVWSGTVWSGQQVPVLSGEVSQANSEPSRRDTFHSFFTTGIRGLQLFRFLLLGLSDSDCSVFINRYKA